MPGGYYSRRVAAAAREAGLRTLYTSEPTTASHDAKGLQVVGRFTIRCGHPDDMARRLVSASPFARLGMWTSWNAKGVIKPILGQSYAQVADWIVAR